MSTIPVTGRPGSFGSVGILRHLVAGRGVRSGEENRTHGADEPVMVNPADIRPSPDTADRDDYDVKSLDAVAGSEFVDDRIREE